MHRGFSVKKICCSLGPMHRPFCSIPGWNFDASFGQFAVLCVTYNKWCEMFLDEKNRSRVVRKDKWCETMCNEIEMTRILAFKRSFLMLSYYRIFRFYVESISFLKDNSSVELFYLQAKQSIYKARSYISRYFILNRSSLKPQQSEN